MRKFMWYQYGGLPTVDSYIIIRVKNSYLMQFHAVNICQIMVLGFSPVYNKHEMIKIGNQTREISQMYE